MLIVDIITKYGIKKVIPIFSKTWQNIQLIPIANVYPPFTIKYLSTFFYVLQNLFLNNYSTNISPWIKLVMWYQKTLLSLSKGGWRLFILFIYLFSQTWQFFYEWRNKTFDPAWVSYSLKLFHFYFFPIFCASRYIFFFLLFYALSML